MTTNTIRQVKNTLHELAGQVYVLATGLQNAAPPGAVPASVQYLLEIAALLEQTNKTIDDLLTK